MWLRRMRGGLLVYITLHVAFSPGLPTTLHCVSSSPAPGENAHPNAESVPTSPVLFGNKQAPAAADRADSRSRPATAGAAVQSRIPGLPKPRAIVKPSNAIK